MSQTRPDADEVARRCADLVWGQDAVRTTLGLDLVAIEPGEATVAMTVRAHMLNGWDTCHGGVLATLADAAFAVASNSRGQVTVAAGFDIAFLEAARLDDELVATAREVALRGRSGLYDVTVRRPADDAVVAELRGRSRSLGRPSPALDA